MYNQEQLANPYSTKNYQGSATCTPETTEPSLEQKTAEALKWLSETQSMLQTLESRLFGTGLKDNDPNGIEPKGPINYNIGKLSSGLASCVGHLNSILSRL